MRLLLLLGLAAVLAASSGGASASSSAAQRVNVAHGLSILVPPGWRISHEHFTACSDPVERFSLLGSGQILTLEERLVPDSAELARRPRHFDVRGTPAPLECCAIPGRRGWVVEFGDHGRAFYAYLYPGTGPARPLLRTLDSLLVA
jgi:hypothetical protein